MEKDCLSKSEYCRAKQCNKILWLDKNKPEYAEAIANDSVLENGSEVGKLAKGLLGEHVDILYQENINNMIEELKNDIEGKEKQEEIRRGLLAYCKLDTLAMVNIWEKLREVVNG